MTQSPNTLRQLLATVAAIRALVRDDAWAITHQSTDEYRTNLLRSIDAYSEQLAAAAPLNGIAATMFHGEGAIACCSYCGRYSLDRKTLGDRPPKCECGEKHGWSGSFKKPGPDAKWSGAAPAAAEPCAHDYARSDAVCAERGETAPTADERAPANERACPFCETVHDGNSCMGAYRERASQAAAPASFDCDDCRDTGQVCVGTSGREDDGNALEFERCPSCGYGEQAAAPAEAREPADQHSDDAAIDAFAAEMKAKMAASRAKGRSGWEACPPADLSRMLLEHVAKGDPIDVANFCMMLSHLDSPISAPADAGEAALFADDDEHAEFEKACSDFEDNGETDVDYGLLMKWACAGLLECDHFQITPAGIDAAQGAQSEGSEV